MGCQLFDGVPVALSAGVCVTWTLDKIRSTGKNFCNTLPSANVDFLLVRAVSPDVVVATACEALSVVTAAAGVSWRRGVVTLGAGLVTDMVVVVMMIVADGGRCDDDSDRRWSL